jgi:uncharacterized repeat protein (TIGR02543 family)
MLTKRGAAMKNAKISALAIFLVFIWFFPAYASEVDDINAAIQAQGALWTAAQTTISVLPPAQQEIRLGLLTAPPPLGQTRPMLKSPLLSAPLPVSLDWRNNNGNYVTGVRDQGDCGSCWAFASTATLESATLIKNKTPNTDLDLSEQVAVSCSGEGSCSGGYLIDDFFVTTGLPLESCYPYTGGNGSCSNACANWQNDAYKISNYTWVVPYGAQQSADALKNALVNYGPIAVTMAVYSDFYYYSTGVYSHVTGYLSGYHAILLVGYDDTNGCFIVKNSWGTGWGESGFFRIAYSEMNDAVDFGYEALAYTINSDSDQAKLNLTVNPGGSGSITANPASPKGLYNFGDTVQLTAVPLGCSDFQGWSGDASGSLNPVSVVMDTDKTVTADFSTKKVGLTTAVNDPQGGTVTSGGSYDCGSAVQVTATASRGYSFAGWSGDASGAANPLTVVMDKEKSVTANFSPGGISLSSSINGTSVSLTAEITYNHAAVAGQTLIFYVDNKLQTQAVTDVSGTAVVTFACSPGDHLAYAVFTASGGVPTMRSDNLDFSIILLSYRITVTSGDNGGITPGTMDVVWGTNQTFNVAPATGYAVGNVTVDDDSKGVMTSWTFLHVEATHTIAATFIPTITATAGAGGSVSPPGTARVASGANQTYTITPSAGYHVTDVLVDGVSAGALSTYTFSNVTAPHTISASFAQNAGLTITVNAGANGTITPGTTSVVQGTSQTFAIAAASGYAIGNVTVDGSNKGVMTSWTFTNVQTAHTIAATFIPTITATAGAGGSVSPSGTTRVASGANQTYTIKANAGYQVTDVLVDGSSVGAVGAYTFSNVTAPHTISASFAQNPGFTITVNAGANGTITPGTTSVVQGTNQTFAIAAASGYAIGNVTVDGSNKGVMTSWTFTNVQTAHTMAATFIPTITAAAGANGSISPSGTARVASGANQTYTIKANAGYQVTDVLVDGSSVGAVGTYTFSNVTTPHTISASFAQNPSFTITVAPGANGSMTPGTTSVVQGTSQTFAIAAASGYAIGNVTVDGTSKGVMTSWTFTNVQAAHTIAATFIPTITAAAGANGSISPSGTARVASGANQTYTIKPKTKYHVADVLVDGSSVGALGTYTFSDVTTAHTISATFAAN